VRPTPILGAPWTASELLHALRPQSPFANIPVCFGTVVEFQRTCFATCENRYRSDRADLISHSAWGDKCQALLDAAPPIKAGLTVSFVVPGDIPGNNPACGSLLGGSSGYSDSSNKVADLYFDGSRWPVPSIV